MAATLGRSAITQLTASGTSTTLTVTTYAKVLLVKQSNGTGAISAAGTAAVQYQTNGGSLWFTQTTFVFSTTAAQVDDLVINVPDGVASIRLVWVQPVGATSPTLDAEVGTITAV